MANQPQAMRRFRLRDIVEDRRIVLMLALERGAVESSVPPLLTDLPSPLRLLAGLKDSVGERPNHSNFRHSVNTHQNSVRSLEILLDSI